MQIIESYNLFVLAQHVNVFEQDLCKLVVKLKFILLDIHAKINYEKAGSYRLMAQTRFPNS